MQIMMMGQPEAVIEQQAKQEEVAPEVQDDFDLKPEDEANLEVQDRPEVGLIKTVRGCGLFQIEDRGGYHKDCLWVWLIGCKAVAVAKKL